MTTTKWGPAEGAMLRLLREAAGLDQRDLQEALTNVKCQGSSIISNLELGKRGPSWAHLMDMAGALGLRPGVLFDHLANPLPLEEQ